MSKFKLLAGSLWQRWLSNEANLKLYISLLRLSLFVLPKANDLNWMSEIQLIQE